MTMSSDGQDFDMAPERPRPTKAEIVAHLNTVRPNVHFGMVIDLIESIEKEEEPKTLLANDLAYLQPILDVVKAVDSQQLNIFGIDYRYRGANGVFKLFETFIQRQTEEGRMSMVVSTILSNRWRRTIVDGSTASEWRDLAQAKWMACLKKRMQMQSASRAAQYEADWEFTSNLVLTLLFDPKFFVHYYHTQYDKFVPCTRTRLEELERIRADLSEMLNLFPWFDKALQVWCGGTYTDYHTDDGQLVDFQTYCEAAFEGTFDDGREILRHLGYRLPYKHTALFAIVKLMEDGNAHLAIKNRTVWVDLCIRVIEVQWHAITTSGSEFSTDKFRSNGFLHLLLEKCEEFWGIWMQSTDPKRDWSMLMAEQRTDILKAIASVIKKSEEEHRSDVHGAWAFVYFLSSMLMPVWGEIGFDLLAESDCNSLASVVVLHGRIKETAALLAARTSDTEMNSGRVRELLSCCLGLLFVTGDGNRAVVAIENVIHQGSVGVGFFDSEVARYLERVLTRISIRFWHDHMAKVMRDLLVHFCPGHKLLTNAATGNGEYCVEELLACVVPVAVGRVPSVGDESREWLGGKSVVRAYCDLVHGTIDTFPRDNDEKAMECNDLLLKACTQLFDTPLIAQTRDSMWLKERLEAGKSGDAGRPFFEDVDQQGSEPLPIVCARCLVADCRGCDADDVRLCQAERAKYLFSLEDYRALRKSDPL